MTSFIKQRKVSEQVAPLNKKFLTFRLGHEEYAIDILQIQEIKSSKTPIQITKIADAPPHIKGIIHYHDRIVPLVDLRVFYHLDSASQNEFNVVIILNLGKTMIGIIVDAVNDIVELSKEEIKEAPDLFSLINLDYTEGVGTLNERILIILNVEKLLSSKEMQVAEHAVPIDDVTNGNDKE